MQNKKRNRKRGQATFSEWTAPLKNGDKKMGPGPIFRVDYSRIEFAADARHRRLRLWFFTANAL